MINLYLFNNKNRGAFYGVGSYVRELVASLRGSGIRIHVVYLFGEKAQIERWEEGEVSYLSFPEPVAEDWVALEVRQRAAYFRNIVYLLRRFIRDTEKLVFHLNCYKDEALARELKAAFRCRVVTAAHFSDWSSVIYDNPERLRAILRKECTQPLDDLIRESFGEEQAFYAATDRVIGLSDYMRALLCEDYGLLPDRVAVIPNGMADVADTDRDPVLIREKWQLRPEERIILFVGRLDSIKGVRFLIRAFRKVSRQYLDSRLWIVGDGDYKDCFEEANPIFSQVTLTGFLDRASLLELYRVADVGVVPSLFEPFGYVPVEMMMHGFPVVATATSGLDEVVDDSCGLKVPLAVSADRVEIDADQLAEKILFLLRNPEEARQLGRNGRGRFVERYSSEVFGRNMSAFYESLFAEENPTEEAMEKEKHIDLSVIVPIYNTEAYLPVCLDSLLGIDGPCVEIVLVDDGSTDGSGKIADAYALEDSRIRVIHQANGGASVARNTGLEVARGEYILFVDSDDWVLGDALASLFRTGVESQADVVMGEIRFCDQEGNPGALFNPVKGMRPKVLLGREGFVGLMRDGSYLPTPVRFVCRRDFLRMIGVRFEEGIMHEDELWTPIVLCQAERLAITCTEFYRYRQDDSSVMHTTKWSRRLRSLFRVVDGLAQFADRWSFDGEERELKSWWYANLFRLYQWAFAYLAEVRDSSIEVPACHLDRFWRNCGEMIPEAAIRCREYYQKAENHLKEYTDWRMSDSVIAMTYWSKTNKRILLIFNTVDERIYVSHLGGLPSGWVVTTDRKYIGRADWVVFHLPSLSDTLEYDLAKPEGQRWASWYAESEQDDPLFNDTEIMDLFDISIRFTTFGECIEKIVNLDV